MDKISRKKLIKERSNIDSKMLFLETANKFIVTCSDDSNERISVELTTMPNTMRKLCKNRLRTLRTSITDKLIDIRVKELTNG